MNERNKAVRQYLRSARYLDEEINLEMKDLSDMRRRLFPYDGAAYAKLAEMEQSVNEKIDRYIDMKAETARAVEALENPEERLLVRYRYLSGYSMERTAYLMSVSVSTAQRLDVSALEHIQNFLKFDV